jgi:hypothetical protein
MDSFLALACASNIHISVAIFYQQGRYRGYTANQRQDFYSLRTRFLLIGQEESLEVFIPGAVANANTQSVSTSISLKKA